MKLSDTGEPTASPAPPASPSHGSPLSYGNIYTPHAGSMIIQVQRESGLQSRTIVLSPRQVRVLRFLTSRTGKIVAACSATIMLAITIQAGRVPALTRQMTRMEHTAVRLDTLERSLSELQKRYAQVLAMMGADSAAGATRAIQNSAALSAAASPAAPGSAAAAPGSSADASAAAPLDGDGTVPAALADPPKAPVRAHRRVARPVIVPPKADSAAEPDSGVVPSAQAEPQ